VFSSNLGADPAVCSNMQGYTMVVGLNSNPGNSIDQTYSMAFTGLEWTSQWLQVKTRKFTSGPTCVFESPYRYRHQPTTHKFVFAGRATDGKLYAIEGHQDLGGPPPDPVLESGTDWALVNGTVYTGNYGRPAAAANDSMIVLTFIDNSGKISALTHPTPYAGKSWSTTAKAGPALPSGWTSDGIPAITYVRGPSGSATNKFVVMVRAVSSGVARFYWIYFDGTNWGTTWTTASAPPSFDSDPALEYDDQTDALTFYYRSVIGGPGVMMQTSVHRAEDIGSLPYFSMAPGNGPLNAVTVSSPRAAFGAGFDEGIRSVVTRGTLPDTQPADQLATILVAEDRHANPFDPYQNDALGSDGNAGCVPDGYHVNYQFFTNGMTGCQGAVSFAQRGDRCWPGSHPCTAAEYVASRGSVVPTSMYWTNDTIKYTGNASSCSVSTTTGTACPSGRTMHVCNASGADADGNTCNFHNCGYGTTSPDQYFGGCSGDTAGTLCCLSVP
jgi:hypothetical protein